MPLHDLENARQFLKDNPDFSAKIGARVREALGLTKPESLGPIRPEPVQDAPGIMSAPRTIFMSCLSLDYAAALAIGNRGAGGVHGGGDVRATGDASGAADRPR